MALRIPCNCCISDLKWRSLPSKTNFNSNSFKWHRKITSELQTQVPVTGRTDYSSPSVPTHKVTVHDRQRGVVHEFVVPEDQYILHTAESQNITLPFACRHGCCTSCAVRIKTGQIRQPEALGISAELKDKISEPLSNGDVKKFLPHRGNLRRSQGDGRDRDKEQGGPPRLVAIPRVEGVEVMAAAIKNNSQVYETYVVMQGYALLCVGFPSSDIEVETQDEDEVYWLQFGRYFARGPVERDDYALELAMGDE